VDRTKTASRGHDARALAVLEMAAAAAAGALIVLREPRIAGLLVLLAGAAGAAAGDLADRSGIPRSVFLADAAERFLDAFVLSALAWTAFPDEPRAAGVALAALGAGAVTAYIRAKGRSLGYRVPRWPAYRTLRAGALAAGLVALTAEPALWAVLSLDAVVGVARWGLVARQGAPA
jgi:hypothetical protein